MGAILGIGVAVGEGSGVDETGCVEVLVGVGVGSCSGGLVGVGVGSCSGGLVGVGVGSSTGGLVGVGVGSVWQVLSIMIVPLPLPWFHSFAVQE